MFPSVRNIIPNNKRNFFKILFKSIMNKQNLIFNKKIKLSSAIAFFILHRLLKLFQKMLLNHTLQFVIKNLIKLAKQKLVSFLNQIKLQNRWVVKVAIFYQHLTSLKSKDIRLIAQQLTKKYRQYKDWYLKNIKKQVLINHFDVF